MKKLLALLALPLALTGCGNMTPQERSDAAQAFGAVLGGAAAAAGAYAGARYAPQPVYVVPVYRPRCFQWSNGAWNCY